MVKLPHRLEKYIPVLPSLLNYVRKDAKGAFHIACISSGEADVEDNCSSKACGIVTGMSHWVNLIPLLHVAMQTT